MSDSAFNTTMPSPPKNPKPKPKPADPFLRLKLEEKTLITTSKDRSIFRDL